MTSSSCVHIPSLHWSLDIKLGDYVDVEHAQRLRERPLPPLVGAARSRRRSRSASNVNSSIVNSGILTASLAPREGQSVRSREVFSFLCRVLPGRQWRSAGIPAL